MNANANKAPFKQSSPARSLPLCISPYKEINHTLLDGGEDGRGRKAASCGTVTSLSFCRDMKERRDINDVSGIPPGKVEGLKGKMRALLVFFFFFASPVPCCFNKARKGTRERGGRKERVA